MTPSEETQQNPAPKPETRKADEAPVPVKEIGGRRVGLEPTRYGDWEKQGRCIDF